MNRRRGFTITELLVSMALIIFIMLILTEAFSAGLETFRRLKAIGDMQERARTAMITLRRDLTADHFGDGSAGPKLSDQACNEAPPIYYPPRTGYFRIWQQPPPQPGQGDPDPQIPGTVVEGTHNSIIEGTEAISGPIGMSSVRSTAHVLQFTCRRKTYKAERDSFRTVNVPPSASSPPNTPLTVLEDQGPDAYKNRGFMNTPWYEVAYFLRPVLDPTGAQMLTTTAPGEQPTPLFALYRRERAVSMHGNPRVPDPNAPKVPIWNPNAPYSRLYEDVSTGSYAPPLPYVAPSWSATTLPQMYVNQPEDLADPRCRFGMHHDAGSVAGRPVSTFKPVPPGPLPFPMLVPPPRPNYPGLLYPAWSLADELAASPGATQIGDDILLTDVISFDIKVLQQGWQPISTQSPPNPLGDLNSNYFHPTFVDLPPPGLSRNLFFQPPSSSNPTGQSWSVFDTWCAQQSPQYASGPNPDPYATWWSPNTESSLPLPIRIHAIQITIRIWDQKTEQARQVSLIQDM